MCLKWYQVFCNWTPWETIGEGRIFENEGDRLPIARTLTQRKRCSRCEKIKQRVIKTYYGS